VLGRVHRLTASRLFGPTVRRGRRAGSRTLVFHLAGPDNASSAQPPAAARPAQVGFVVSRAVGTAVTRNSVKRRLRHLARERISSLPDASMLVVRALPAAGTASYQELGADLDRCLERLLGQVLGREGRR
jgi:ribonuclease P protein component